MNALVRRRRNLRVALVLIGGWVVLPVLGLLLMQAVR